MVRTRRGVLPHGTEGTGSLVLGPLWIQALWSNKFKYSFKVKISVNKINKTAIINNCALSWSQVVRNINRPITESEILDIPTIKFNIHRKWTTWACMQYMHM